ncbi:aryl-sulfate sulfotransferase [bacterium]|nr:aryl-sulfate sulfotransferase [bacterium]
MKKIILGLLILSFIFSWDLLKPIDGATLNQTHVLFEWEQQPNNAFYVLTVSENIEFQGCIICEQYIDESLIYIAKDVLNWDTQYWWKITAYDNNNQLISQVHELNIGSPIANATANIYENNVQEGLTIFGSFFDYYSAVIDQNGNEIWNSGNQDLIFYNTDKYGRFFGAEFIGNNAENNYPGVKFSFENGIEWQEPGTNFIHHDIFQLPNGNYIGLGTSNNQGVIPFGPWTPLFQALGYNADGQTVEFNWMGDKIIEWNADTKEEVWTWNTFDHFNMEDYDSLGGIWFEAYNTGRFDWTHANAIWFDEDDSAIYLSSRHLNRITKIAYPSGEIIWNLGHELGSGDIDCGQDIGFSFQHSLQKLNNGNILTFDNGNLSREFLNQDTKTSRSIEIQINENDNGCEANLDWEYVLPEELYGYLSGNTQKLDNENYLSTTIGGGGTSLEVDQDGNAIWEANYNLSLPDGLVYRAMKIPGLFPIAYSVILNQFENSMSEMILEENDSLNILIKNNGDYTQIFNYQLNAEIHSQGYDIDLIITPEHFPNHEKNISFLINTTNFNIDSQNGSFILNPNQKILLSMIDNNALSNDDIINPIIFEIKKAYPNPFNPEINFDINMKGREYINIYIYNIQGNQIDNIFNGFLNKGIHSFNWDASNYATGLYIIKVAQENNILTQKIMLIK